MSLLREIQIGATDHTAPLADLLRKCLILAQRLQHEPLAEWAKQELSGYPSTDSLPPYRKYSTEARGDFINPAWQVKNALIPPSAVEEEHREVLFTLVYSDGVAHYEALLHSGQNKFAAPWPADVIAFYSTRLMEGYHLREARRVVTRGMLEGMLDQIRNRILSFALEIEKENPAAGEAELGGDPPVTPEKVQQSFITNIHGGTNIVAPGGQAVVGDVTINQGNWESLHNALKTAGLLPDDIAALERAIEEDEASDEVPGPAVKNWLGDITARIASGSLTLITSVAGSGIATMVMKYLGVV